MLGADGQPDPAAVAKTSAFWTLGITAAIVLFRVLRFRHRWMLFTGAVVLQTVLHGLFSMGYLLAGVIALAAAIPAYALVYRGRGVVATLLLGCTLMFATAGEVKAQHGETPASDVTAALEDLPEALSEFFAETDAEGNPLIPPTSQAYFAGLPAHAQELFGSAIDEEMISGAGHAAALLGLGLDAERFEQLLGDNCILCHSDADMQDESTLMQVEDDADFGPSHLSLADFLGGAHFRRGLSCSGCHGGSPADVDMADEIYDRWPESDVRRADRSWVPDFCGRCHADPAFMRRYAPSMQTDQLAKYRTSMHGQLLAAGDSKAAQCLSCHGTHGIRGAQSRLSSVHAQNVPRTCSACHADAEYMSGYTTADGGALPTNQFEQYSASVHGQALLTRGDLGAPACNDCHGNHAAMPPEVAHVSQVCRTCHAGNGAAFDGSRHKVSFERNGWPECEQCHGKHDISPTSDEMLGTQPGQLCYDCHDQYAGADGEECVATADHFRETIGELVAGHEHLERQVEELAEKGLDVESLENSTADLHDAVRASRSAIHSFERSDFDLAAAPGLQALAAGEVSILASEEEFKYRRTGLLISIGVLGFLALMLWLKIRQVDQEG